MSVTTPLLHLFAGKICAGKSTLARKISAQPGTILLSEDRLLSDLYGNQMQSISDYVKYSARLRYSLQDHIVDMLNNGLSVALDFPANTKELRLWYRFLIDHAHCEHQMHVLELSDEECLDRLHQRNVQADYPIKVSDEQFFQISGYYEPPTDDEGFNLVIE